MVFKDKYIQTKVGIINVTVILSDKVIYNLNINIIKLSSKMSDINSSLIGYLKKKSLFSDSPNKSIRLK